MGHLEELVIAQKWVRDAEIIVERQRFLVETLRRDGHPTTDAERLLSTFVASLNTLRDHLRIVQSET